VSGRKHRIAWTFFPRYSRTIDRVNQNASLRAWVAAHPEVPRHPDGPSLYRSVNALAAGMGPVDYIEFGVAGGTSLRAWSRINVHPESRFFGFDTFTGLPEDWGRSFPKGSFGQEGRLPTFDDPRVELVPGLFQTTVPAFLARFEPRGALVVHQDSDLYSSTMYCLTRLDSICRAGTVVIFDEFCGPLDEFRAYQDYLRSYRRSLRPVGMLTTDGVPDAVALVFE
jgi:O-methyltransferase